MANRRSSSDEVSSESDKEKTTQVEPKWESKNPFAKDSGDQRREITSEEAAGKLGYDFPSWKKWAILSVIFTVQVSMNFNTSLYRLVVKHALHTYYS